MKLLWVLLIVATDAGPCFENQQCTSCESNGRCISQCNNGYYGFKCNLKCSTGCRNSRCQLNNNGYHECTDGCNLGFYGTQCSISCDLHNNTCRKCPKECEGGFCQLGSSCAQGCQDSYYGTACKSCPAGCEVCNRVLGTCEICLHCEGDCTEGCLEECGDGYFGKFCEHSCSSKCASRCDQKTGYCFKCKPGLFGDTCKNQCSDRCLDKECDIDGVCTHGCTEGWYGSRCECLPSCAGGRCDRNGKCTDGCKIGFHGEQCQNNCSVNCISTPCDIEDGSCKSCKKGFYGSHCNKSCVRCIDDDCLQDTGHCIHGCLSNYEGVFCQHNCEGNCTTNECREACKTYHETKIVLGEDRTNYIPYTVTTAVVLIVALLVIYAGCRFRKLQSMIYGMKEGHGHQLQPRRIPIEEAAEPAVNFYTAVEEDVLRPPQLPRRCGPQLQIAENSDSSRTLSQSGHEEADDERTSTSLSNNTDQRNDSTGSSHEPETDAEAGDSVQGVSSCSNSSSADCDLNNEDRQVEEGISGDVSRVHAVGSNTHTPDNADISSPLDSQGCCIAVSIIPVQPRKDTKECQKGGAASPDFNEFNAFSLSIDNAAGNQEDRPLDSKEDLRTEVEISSATIMEESADDEDGETNDNLSNISVPVIADCYDNFSADNEEEACPTPSPANYSKLFTLNYVRK